MHDGIVTVAFCDGRVKVLSKNIDPLIYARLMTPAGRSFGEKMVGNNDY